MSLLYLSRKRQWEVRGQLLLFNNTVSLLDIGSGDYNSVSLIGYLREYILSNLLNELGCHSLITCTWIMNRQLKRGREGGGGKKVILISIIFVVAAKSKHVMNKIGQKEQLKKKEVKIAFFLNG